MFMTKGSTYIAVVPLTAVVSQNSLTYWLYQIPEPEPEPGQLWFPINLVFCLMFDTKLKKLHYLVIWLKHWLKIWVGSSQQTTNNWSCFQVGWSGRWWRCWRNRPRTDPPTLTSDLKKWKNINTHPIFIVIDHHFLPYTGLVIELISNIFNVITDYLPFVN